MATVEVSPDPVTLGKRYKCAFCGEIFTGEHSCRKEASGVLVDFNTLYEIYFSVQDGDTAYALSLLEEVGVAA